MPEPGAPVIDASPVILLARAQLLHLLSPLSPWIAVPTAVAREIRAKGPEDVAVQALASTPWLRVVRSVPAHQALGAWELGAGERAVLAWAARRPGTLAILDDAEARRCAKSLNVPVIGTLGLVLRAKRAGLLAVARPTVEKLVSHGMYVAENILETALALIDE